MKMATGRAAHCRPRCASTSPPAAGRTAGRCGRGGTAACADRSAGPLPRAHLLGFRQAGQRLHGLIEEMHRASRFAERPAALGARRAAVARGLGPDLAAPRMQRQRLDGIRQAVGIHTSSTSTSRACCARRWDFSMPDRRSPASGRGGSRTPAPRRGSRSTSNSARRSRPSASRTSSAPRSMVAARMRGLTSRAMMAAPGHLLVARRQAVDARGDDAAHGVRQVEPSIIRHQAVGACFCRGSAPCSTSAGKAFLEEEKGLPPVRSPASRPRRCAGDLLPRSWRTRSSVSSGARGSTRSALTGPASRWVNSGRWSRAAASAAYGAGLGDAVEHGERLAIAQWQVSTVRMSGSSSARWRNSPTKASCSRRWRWSGRGRASPAPPCRGRWRRAGRGARLHRRPGMAQALQDAVLRLGGAVLGRDAEMAAHQAGERGKGGPGIIGLAMRAQHAVVPVFQLGEEFVHHTGLAAAGIAHQHDAGALAAGAAPVGGGQGGKLRGAADEGRIALRRPICSGTGADRRRRGGAPRPVRGRAHIHMRGASAVT